MTRLAFTGAPTCILTCIFIGALTAKLPAPAAAKDSLGVYGDWAAFRDADPARCYAIAQPQRGSDSASFASIANWPDQGIRTQLHIRLSRGVADDARVTLTIGTQRFELTAKGRDAWAHDTQMDAAVIAALRSATRMSVSARAANGARFTDRYALSGVATAIDAALVGCA